MAKNGNGGNGGESNGKAPRDYARLLDEAELLSEGYESRYSKQRAQLASLMRDIPNREVIMQTFERFADTRASFKAQQAKVENYKRLMAEAAEEAAKVTATA